MLARLRSLALFMSMARVRTVVLSGSVARSVIMALYRTWARSIRSWFSDGEVAHFHSWVLFSS
jgi:fructose-1-phosphate kinase PfkB-like protein